MGLFEWKEEYSVGVNVLDNHHRKLVSIVNDMHDAMKQGKGTAIVIPVIKELVDYTKYHFGEEERLMAQAECPDLDEHKNVHKQFVAKLEEYKDKIDKGQCAFLSIDLSTFLIDWLISHIGGMDKKYQHPMNSKGIK